MADVDTKKFVDHLKDKWKGEPCPLCKSGNWNVTDKVYELREFHDGNMVIGIGQIVPVVPVTCDNCGNTVLVNSILAGTTSRQKEKDND
jgi:hypothetical protein